MELLITDLLNSRKIGKITHTHYEKLRNTHYQYKQRLFEILVEVSLLSPRYYESSAPPPILLGKF